MREGIHHPIMEKSKTMSAGKARPAWWLVFLKELSMLWIGGRALILILIFSVLLGIITYVLASNSELSLIPPKEMVFELLKIAVAFGGFISLIIGADAISGERERATLEWLLLTPVSRRQLILGKFLAAVSPWPAALAVTIPYLYLAAQGDEAFGAAVLWGAVLGSLLAPALAALGMLISTWSNSNRTSFMISLGFYLLILVPTQLPGTAQTGAAGKFLKKVSPMESIYHFLEKTLVNNRTFDELSIFLIAPALFALIMTGLLLGFAAGLHLEAGAENRFRRLIGRILGGILIACLAVAGLPNGRAQASHVDLQTGPSMYEITVNMESAEVNTGDPVEYVTVITNRDTGASPGLIVAMNIINLDAEGDIVDPEDWSPERTQYLDSLAPGESASLEWRVNAILEGDYMVYMVVIPRPGSTTATSQPTTSSGIHLTVHQFTRINPLGVLPYIIGTPLILSAVIYLIYKARRRAYSPGLS